MNRIDGIRRLLGICVVVAAAWNGAPLWGQSGSGPSSAPHTEILPEKQEDWEYYAAVPLPGPQPAGAQDGASKLIDVILRPNVFSHARPDLADLRLYDPAQKTIPYALRILRPESVLDRVPAVEFNREEPEGGTQALTLDLQRDDIQYNKIQIETSKSNFRRAAEVEGSDDGKSWRRLAAGNLLDFKAEGQKFVLDSFDFPAARFRYVRLRVRPDPDSEDAEDRKDDFRITDVKVMRQVDVPGERLTLDAAVGPREPVRTFGAPGSAWIIDLGGENVPCDRIEVDVADAEFARTISLAVEIPAAPPGRATFSPVVSRSDLSWQRKLSDPKTPMIVEFSEIQAHRLRLLIADYRNPPLTIQSIKFSAAARQVVFARPEENSGDPRLSFGNPHAELTNYDFARNLPAKLDPPPARAELIEVERNPNFVPPPQPFTERLPWLIYAVLGSVTAVLALVIVSLSRSAIEIHDAGARDQPVTTS